MGKWADPQIDRYQQTLFAPTLDAMIAADHPVRLFDELLQAMDWSAWEARYELTVGQPPIHPRFMAGIILYGLTRKITSSRQLEYACQSSIDFMWLAQRQRIDHATICKFRHRFRAELKDLFTQLGGLAMRMGLIRLNEMALDGTRIRANSSRHGLATAATLVKRVAALDEQIEQMLCEAEAADAQESLLEGSSGTPAHLPRTLSDAQRRRTTLGQALAAATAQEAKRGGQAHPTAADPAETGEADSRGDAAATEADVAAPAQTAAPGSADAAKTKKAPRVPVADPESTLLPNKDGGYAPNYTVLAAADGRHGLLVDAAVIADNDEGAHTLETVDQVEATFGEQPERFLADGAYGSGANLAGLESRGVEGYIPQTQREDTAGNPAKRADPTAPVPQRDWAQLPRSKRTKKLDRAAFIYDAGQDCYYCPMGHRLAYWQRRDRQRRRGRVANRLYRATTCAGCPLAGACVSGKGPNRTVSRDEYEALREAMDARLSSDAGQARYRRRSWIAETPNAVIKQWMGVRQFLTRGLQNVTTEWWWVCTAFNLAKLVRLISAMRRRLWALAA